MNLPLTIYSYTKCSTCRKALNWLEENNLEYVLVDIIESPPTKELLSEAFKQLETRNKLFNTSGISYRQLGSAVVKAMSDDEALDALHSDGKLIKRPFVIDSNGKILVGFNPDIWRQVLLN